jgi:hypothetical protein
MLFVVVETVKKLVIITAFTKSTQPNVVVLLRIREVPGSGIDPETDYTEASPSFPQSLQANSGITP